MPVAFLTTAAKRGGRWLFQVHAQGRGDDGPVDLFLQPQADERLLARRYGLLLLGPPSARKATDHIPPRQLEGPSSRLPGRPSQLLPRHPAEGKMASWLGAGRR